ncbi:heat-labile enterotoxin alpha chain domain-containing protein [Hirsutella rhossiliensis]|uniref:Heat-labile enterotoxin alpha chain domain-containing protein n=1 Tax=Hirsutella rhossiliensis TaxID=111463 RepID=A0A9P8MZ14_9HYPO|nr:heat-labile enterotoxin alpha chain domain-containing protein [Hirsutella rhossiliensis]KAH0961722.1 heat-labile enterotoxin alpha chain domain-containing protein [Hirsutella rhossiliensis]
MIGSMAFAVFAGLALATALERRNDSVQVPSPNKTAPIPNRTAPMSAASPEATLLAWIEPGLSWHTCEIAVTEQACGTKLFCTTWVNWWYPKGTYPYQDAKECLAARAQPPLPTIVYRGDPRPPEEFRRRGGIAPKKHGARHGNRSYSLQAHHEGKAKFADAYVSTTSWFSVALGYAVGSGKRAYVYRVRPTPNMIDLDASGVVLKYATENEFAALGGVRWDQIEAWMPMLKNITGRGFDRDEIQRFKNVEAFQAEFPEYMHAWVINDEYNSTFDSLSASHGEPRLAGTKASLAKYKEKTLEQWAVEFMDKNGAAVGWTGKFLLDSPPDGGANGSVPGGGSREAAFERKKPIPAPAPDAATGKVSPPHGPLGFRLIGTMKA